MRLSFPPYVVPLEGLVRPSVSLFKSLFSAFSCYICIIPLILIDVFLWQFQRVYFRIYDIPLIVRSEYVILDRYRLGRLTFWQRCNCLYCEYANGVIGFAKAVINQMELYSCAIKHATQPLGQEHQKKFWKRSDFEE